MKEFIKSKWGKTAVVLLLLQFVSGATLMGALVILNMLPEVYLIICGAFLLLLVILSFRLLFSRKRKTKKNGKKKSKIGMYIKRILGTILSVILTIGCLIGTYAVVKGIGTLSDILNDTVTIEETTSAFVLKDDPAKSISDAADYTFGVTESYDWQNTQDAIADINNNLGQEIKTQKYDSVLEMVDALKSKQVGAILLNEAYVDVLKDIEGYENFSDETRTLYASTKQVVQKVEEKKDVEKEPFVVYISGSDTRSKTLAKSRSDVNILAVINPETKQVLLVNTPRDYYVSTTVSGASKDKLTHCGVYGIECSMGTLAALYDVDVTHYAQINFTGFETLIDAIGGITVYSEKTTKTREGGYQIYEGDNEMSGAVALAFVRDRYNFAGGDLARGNHQMAVVKAVIKKICSGTTIINNYSAILDSIEGMFVTDFTSSEISSLAKMQLKDAATWNVQTYSVTGTGGSAKTYSMPTQNAYVMYPDEASVDYAKTLIQKVMNGETLSEEDMTMPSSNTEQ